jgi:HPt (histidine-containing phosphotransfer) domain-containing protein
MLDARNEGWRDAVHTLRGAAAGIGAGALAEACQSAEATDKASAPPLLDRVRDALEMALADVAAYRHELMLRSLRA